MIAGGGGIALFIVLLLNRDLSQIGEALKTAGWWMGVIVVFHSLPLLVDAGAWQVLLPPQKRPPLLSLWWMRWVGESVSNLLPFAQIGGDLVRARLASVRGKVPMANTIASVIADITISIFTEVVFVVTGVALVGHMTGVHRIAGPFLLGSAVAFVAIVAFWALQRWGLFGALASLACKLAKSGDWDALAEKGQSLDEALQDIYSRRADVLRNAFWTSTSWAVGAVEVWIALYAIGFPASYAKAYVLESVGQAITDVAFLIPGAFGVFEGGYVVVGAALGIPGDTAMALALIRRVREAVIGIAGIILWQWVEGRRLWQLVQWRENRKQKRRQKKQQRASVAGGDAKRPAQEPDEGVEDGGLSSAKA